LGERSECRAESERRRPASSEPRDQVRILNAGRAACAARENADTQDQEREAADQVAERLAVVPLLDLQRIGLAAIFSGSDTDLDATARYVHRQPDDQGAVTPRENRQFLLTGEDAEAVAVGGTLEAHGDG
jgi:hypothetical protein